METIKTLDITPQTKVRELIDAYPDLEEVIIEMAPAFKKLKNPVLRNTIARITTLSQAAKLANIEISDMINTLRKLNGQEKLDELPDAPQAPSDLDPYWFDESQIVHTLDARPMLEAGQHPIGEVFDKLSKMQSQEILKLITGFVPIPLIDKAREKGYETHTINKSAEEVFTYFYKL